jgi:hypothetical protein
MLRKPPIRPVEYRSAVLAGDSTGPVQNQWFSRVNLDH